MNKLRFEAYDKITNRRCDVVTISWKTWDIDPSTINYVTIATDDGYVDRMENEVTLIQLLEWNNNYSRI